MYGFGTSQWNQQFSEINSSVKSTQPIITEISTLNSIIVGVDYSSSLLWFVCWNSIQRTSIKCHLLQQSSVTYYIKEIFHRKQCESYHRMDIGQYKKLFILSSTIHIHTQHRDSNLWSGSAVRRGRLKNW